MFQQTFFDPDIASFLNPCHSVPVSFLFVFRKEVRHGAIPLLNIQRGGTMGSRTWPRSRGPFSLRSIVYEQQTRSSSDAKASGGYQVN